MSYGKYGMKNIGGFSPNNMMNVAYNDPWFAAGALLAQNWNKNYEDRGTKKAIDAKLEELSPEANAQERQAALDRWNSMHPSGGLQGILPLGIDGSNTIPAVNGLSGDTSAQKETANEPAATGAGVYAGALPSKPEKGLMEQVKEDALSKGGLLSNTSLLNQLGEFQPALGRASNQAMKDYMGELSAGKSADGNMTLNRSPGIGDIAQDMANQRMRNFDAEQWSANAQLDMLRQGYTPEQIGYIMGPLSQKAAGVQKEQAQRKIGGIVDRYFDLTAAGNYKDAAKLVVDALRYDPQTANYMANSGVSMKELWNLDADTAKKLLDFQLSQTGADANVGRQITLNDHGFGNQVKLAELQHAFNVADSKQKIQMALQYPEIFGRGGKSAGNSLGSLYNNSKSYVEYIDKKKADNPEYQLTPQEKSNYEKATMAITTYYDNMFPDQQPNVNDYHTAVSYFSPIATEENKRKYGGTQIAANIRKAYGIDPDDTSNAFVESIIDDLGLKQGSEIASGENASESGKSPKLRDRTKEIEALKSEGYSINPYTGQPMKPLWELYWGQR